MISCKCNTEFGFLRLEPTLTSMSPILAVERMMGRPTSEGNICAGKFEPA